MSDQGLITLIVMAGVRLHHLPLRWTLRVVPIVSVLEGIHWNSIAFKVSLN